MSHILIVEDEPVIRGALRKLLVRHEHSVAEADSVEQAREQHLNQFDLIISDLRLPGEPGTALIDSAGTTPVLIMTSYASLRSAVDAMRQGAVDYIPKPFDHDEMLLAVERVLKEGRLNRGNRALRRDMERSYPVHNMIGDSDAMQELKHRIHRVGPTNTPVLIMGESGTGKELAARALHQASERAGNAMVTLECAGLSETVFESELFGHVKGAFTGANHNRQGLAEAAHQGTLFLDEIGDLPMAIQVKLLRVLQEREVVRLGSRKSIPIDVRVLAATNVQLEKAINAGHFREDLYYRLDVVSLELSPLRDRPGDILPLTRHFIEAYSQRLGYGPITISREAEQKLKSYSWPGNIRELENVIHHTLLICRNGVIERDDLRLSNMRIERQDDSQHGIDNSAAALLERAFQKLFEEQAGALHEKVEDALLRAAYRFSHYNQVHTANLLGLSRNVTRTRLIKIGELAVNKRRPGENVQGERMLHLSI